MKEEFMNENTKRVLMIIGAVLFISLVVLSVISQCSDAFQNSKLKSLEKKVDGIETVLIGEDGRSGLSKKVDDIYDIVNGKLDLETKRANNAEAERDVANVKVAELEAERDALKLALEISESDRDSAIRERNSLKVELDATEVNLQKAINARDALGRDSKALDKTIAESKDVIIQLKVQVDELEARISDLEAKVSDLEFRVSDLESRVSELENDKLQSGGNTGAATTNVGTGTAVNNGGTGTPAGNIGNVAVVPDAPSNLRLELSSDGKSVLLKWNHLGADYFKVLSSESGDFSSDLNEVPQSEIDSVNRVYSRSATAVASAVGTWVKVVAVKNGIESNPSVPFQIDLSPSFDVFVNGTEWDGKSPIPVKGPVATVSLVNLKLGVELRMATSLYGLNRSEYKDVTFPLTRHISFDGYNGEDEEIYIEVRNEYKETRVRVPIRYTFQP